MKADPRWTEVDQFISDALIPADPVLEAALRDSTAAGLPAISVTAPQGSFLQILAQSLGARRILEVGTLGGYSTIWLARALPPGGQLITLETIRAPRPWRAPTWRVPGCRRSSRCASDRRWPP